jgi:hypothetical protein
MRSQGSVLSTTLVMAVMCAACNHGLPANSAQFVSTAERRAAADTPQAAPPPAAAAGAQSAATAEASSGAPVAKSDVPGKAATSDRTQTLTVAQQTFRLLTHVQSIKSTSDETVEWWELRDANERVVYRESYPVRFQNGTFETMTAITAESFTTKQGAGILIHGSEEPSAPDSGGWVQVFGFKYGSGKYASDATLFGSFGPPIMITGSFLGTDTDSLRPTPVSGASATVMRDVLKFKVWTGNFSIVYPVLVNWISGKLEPAWRCIETTSKGQVERCSYPIMAEGHRDEQPTFVRLFPEPDEGFTPKHVVVQPQAKVEYLEARVPVVWSGDATAISFSVNGDVWIKVRIDGSEGWIHSEEDFEAVGLPQAG